MNNDLTIWQLIDIHLPSPMLIGRALQEIQFQIPEIYCSGTVLRCIVAESKPNYREAFLRDLQEGFCCLVVQIHVA